MTEKILQISGLCCGYAGKTVLRDIYLEVIKGEIISIIGPNGAGKTTLLKALTKLLKPDQGSIVINGRPLTAIPRKELARTLAVVGQTVEQPFLTVEDYVLLGRLPFFSRYQLFQSKKDTDIARRYMALTGLTGMEEALMNEISGGERQLAAIARALVQEPAILLLDEPTAHLDITHQSRILDLIAELNRTLSLTVIMVVHDLNLAGEYSDRLVLLDKESGSVYRCGPPAEVLTEQAVKDIYRAGVFVDKNPVSGKPCLFITREQTR